MPRRCATAQCGGPGVVYLEQGKYVCEPCADKLRLEMAALAAMAKPAPADHEREHHAAQVRNSHSLMDIFPGLRDPAVLAQQVAFWRELENEKETE